MTGHLGTKLIAAALTIGAIALGAHTYHHNRYAHDTTSGCADQMYDVGLAAIAATAPNPPKKINPNTLNECDALTTEQQQQAADQSRWAFMTGHRP